MSTLLSKSACSFIFLRRRALAHLQSRASQRDLNLMWRRYAAQGAALQKRASKSVHSQMSLPRHAIRLHSTWSDFCDSPKDCLGFGWLKCEPGLWGSVQSGKLRRSQASQMLVTPLSFDSMLMVAFQWALLLQSLAQIAGQSHIQAGVFLEGPSSRQSLHIARHSPMTAIHAELVVPEILVTLETSTLKGKIASDALCDDPSSLGGLLEAIIARLGQSEAGLIQREYEIRDLREREAGISQPFHPSRQPHCFPCLLSTHPPTHGILARLRAAWTGDWRSWRRTWSKSWRTTSPRWPRWPRCRPGRRRPLAPSAPCQTKGSERATGCHADTLGLLEYVLLVAAFGGRH